jgi:quinoprotein glucose dehydrogenase
MRKERSYLWRVGGAALTLVLATSAALVNAREEKEQDGKAPPGAEWAFWGGDAGSTRYAPLDQINAENVGKLEVIWRWRAANFGPEPDNILRATPLYVNGKLYTVAGIRRTVVCIEPTTGETLWMWRENTDGDPRWEASTRKNYGKGVAFAVVDGKPTLFYLGAGFTMWAIDADTGQPVKGFGTGGKVDLAYGLDNPSNPDAPKYKVDPKRGVMDYGDITTSSAPIVVNGVVVVGNSHDRGYYPENKENIPGIVRGYDAKTGKMLWRFDPVPKPGEAFNETWGERSWYYTGNVSPWAPLSADLEKGIVYVPTDTPTNDYYGGHRPGMNVYGTSLVALDAKTGKRVWHFQFVHHDIWNYDTPDAPKLLDITVDGKRIPIVAQATKQGYLYVFNRHTGEPVWPIVERPVPTDSDVPGEKPWPTQPHVTKPPAFEIQGFTEENLIDFTPELKAEALQIAKRHRMGPHYTPPMLAKGPDDSEGGAFVAPGANGGANIPGGAAADPETGWVYVPTQRGFSVIRMVPAKKKYPNAKAWPGWGGQGPTSAYVSTGPGGVPGPSGGRGNPPLPLVKPPYGSIVAYNLNTGEIAWRIPNGNTPDRIRNHPALKGVDVGNTGQNSHANLLVTRTLLFYGEGRGGDRYFHALDKQTGKEIAKIELPAQTNTAPMTFFHNGHQYIVAAVASGNFPPELVCLALPAARPPRVNLGSGN